MTWLAQALDGEMEPDLVTSLVDPQALHLVAINHNWSSDNQVPRRLAEHPSARSRHRPPAWLTEPPEVAVGIRAELGYNRLFVQRLRRAGVPRRCGSRPRACPSTRRRLWRGSKSRWEGRVAAPEPGGGCCAEERAMRMILSDFMSLDGVVQACEPCRGRASVRRYSTSGWILAGVGAEFLLA